MKYFENKNIEKAYQKILNVLYVGLFLLALGIVLFGYSIFKSEEVKPTLLDDIIVNNPVENAYGYIDIISEPVLFAEYGEGDTRAIGKPVALEARAEEREVRGLISMTTIRSETGSWANCTLVPPITCTDSTIL